MKKLQKQYKDFPHTIHLDSPNMVNILPYLLSYSLSLVLFLSSMYCVCVCVFFLKHLKVEESVSIYF